MTPLYTVFVKSNASPFLLLSIVLGYYVVAINGSHPMIRWEMERGLDMTISSVAGESYTVDVSSVETLFFNDVWYSNLVSFFWQCKKLIQINIFIYIFKVDVSAALQGWVGESFQILVDVEKVKPIWKDTHFTIKYRSDALFDFPYWFGCSKRQFKVCFNK